jgi:bla regulator protein blaR1
MMTLSLLLKVTLVLGAALAGTWIARRSRAAVRHLLLASSFAMLLVLPAASVLSPAVDVIVPRSIEVVMTPLDLAEPVDVSGARESSRDTSRTAAGLPQAWRWPSASEITITIWAAGALIFLLPVAFGLWQVRVLRRSALPWQTGQVLVGTLAHAAGVNRRVDILLHESMPGPMTSGTFWPAIFLPTDATSWPRADLTRAIVHELEHVRRFDWLTQCLARVTAAAYWFHPVVWIAWRRFALEAERACDDAVLCGSNTDDTAYADQLLLLARRLSASPAQLHLAMASRRDLSARIRAVLDNGQQRGRAGRIVVLLSCGLAIVFVAVVSPLRLQAGAVQAATPPASGQATRYDVATVKACEPEDNPTGARGTYGGTNATFSPGRFYVPCVTTEQLIYLAYAGAGVPPGEQLLNDNPGAGSNASKVRGGPDWVHSLRDKYRVEATAAGVTERQVLMGAMLRTLLEERFKLRLHRETEDVAMLKLVVAKNGLKLKPMKEGDCEPFNPVDPVAKSAKPVCGALMMNTVDGLTQWTFGGFPMSQFAYSMSRQAGAHVRDETGLTENYLFRLDFVRDPDAAGSSATKGPDIFTAVQEQLGLKLEPTRGPRGYLVIDAIERPTPDGPVPARAQGPGPRAR